MGEKEGSKGKSKGEREKEEKEEINMDWRKWQNRERKKSKE